MEERRASSTPPPRKATPGDWLLAFPEKRPRGFRHSPGRAERLFNVFSVVLLVLFAMGWSWSIARARASGDSAVVTPASANIATALTDGSAPSVAYLTDAALAALAPPARGESGKLRVRIQQPGTPIDQLLADTLPPGAMATFSSRSAAESTSGSLRRSSRAYGVSHSESGAPSSRSRISASLHFAPLPRREAAGSAFIT